MFCRSQVLKQVEKYQNAQTQKHKADSIPKEKEAHLNNLPGKKTTEDATHA
jgi:hypothetical protein